MAVIKRKTRKKLSKQLTKLIKRHGAEMTLAVVTGIVSNLAADQTEKTSRKRDARPKPIVIRKRVVSRASR